MVVVVVGCGGEGWGRGAEEKGEMKAMNRMREKWLTQNLGPNDRVDARKSKKKKKNVMGEEFSRRSREADKHAVSVFVILMHEREEQTQSPTSITIDRQACVPLLTFSSQSHRFSSTYAVYKKTLIR